MADYSADPLRRMVRQGKAMRSGGAGEGSPFRDEEGRGVEAQLPDTGDVGR
jgi:hypothetical protein